MGLFGDFIRQYGLKVNARQQLFVEFYLADPNATQAAIKAGYSEKTARSQGQRLLTNVDIAKLVGERVKYAAMSANEVLQELADIAKSEWRDFIEVVTDKDGNTVDVKMKLTDKIKALELLGRNHKLFTDKTEVTGKDGGAIEHKLFQVEIVTNDNERTTNKDTD